MKKFFLILSMLFIATFSIFISGCGKDTPVINKENKVMALEISFSDFYIDQQSNPSILQEWDNFIIIHKIKISQIERDIETAEGEFLYGGGEVFEENKYPTTLSAAIQQHAGTTIGHDDAITSLKRQVTELENVLIEKRTAQQTELLQNLTKQLNGYTATNNRISLKSMVLFVPSVSYDAFSSLVNKSDGSIRSLDDIIKNLNNRSSQEAPIEDRDAIAWTPDYGTVETYAISGIKRTVVNHFTWTTKPYSSQWYTYEHDFFLNYYPTSSLPGTYLSRNQDAYGFPICSWYSNLPAKYLDTRFLNNSGEEGNPNEIPYTIGCGDAYLLAKNTDYWSQIITDNGDASSDNAKLWAQSGTQAPTGCTSTWCSFGYANKIVIPAWTLGVPSGYSWVF